MSDPGSSTSRGPCEQWITGTDVAECCGVELSSDNADALDAAAEMATDILYRLSARRFSGECTRIERPCRAGCACTHSGEWDWYWTGLTWMQWDVSLAGWGRGCGCGCISQVTLYGPVREVIEVLIDGEVVDESSYRLDERKYLVRLADSDGNRQAWPRCQRLDLASTEPGTFEITYTTGADPPALALAAACSLACDLYRASTGGTCALPTGVTRIVRAGLTIEKVSSIASMLRSGATGLPLVDSFMAAYNPKGAQLPPMIWSPDLPRARRMD